MGESVAHASARAVFECARCGKCCEDHYPTDEDVRRWKEEGRNDILEYVVDMGDDLVHDYSFYSEELYVLEVGYCPFLSFNGTIYECEIHETKPEMCRDWPLGFGDKETIKARMEFKGCLGKLKEFARS